MLAELLCIAAVYAFAVVCAHGVARRRSEALEQHYVLVAGNHEDRIEWYMRALQSYSRRSGTDVRVAKQGMWSLGYDPNNGYVENYMFGDGIELHSLFADIWVMFGVGGIALALAIIVFTMRGVLHDIATGVASTVAMYLALRLLWDMAFSPWLSSLVLLPLAVGASLTDRVVARQQQETAGRR